MSIHIRLAPLVLLVLAVAGCSAPEAGTPAGEPDPSVSLPSTTSPPPGTTQPKELATIEACDLLTAQEATSLGANQEEHADEIIGLRSCDWITSEGVVSTTIDEELGIDELVLSDASSITEVTIGRHRAKRALEASGPGYCDIFFAIGDKANLSVSALYLNDTPQACAVADQAAEFIEPKLP